MNDELALLRAGKSCFFDFHFQGPAESIFPHHLDKCPGTLAVGWGSVYGFRQMFNQTAKTALIGFHPFGRVILDQGITP